MSRISQIMPTSRPVTCNFVWTYSLSDLVLPELAYTAASIAYPPGSTTIGGGSPVAPGSTLPTAFASLAALQANFDVSGVVVVNDGTHQDTVAYTGLATTGGLQSFTGCTGGTHTFAAGTPINDPRFYIPAAPRNQVINFTSDLLVPSGVAIISYLWQLGDGAIGNGPTVTTTYAYPSAPPEVQVSLMVTDSLRRTASCSQVLNLQ